VENEVQSHQVNDHINTWYCTETHRITNEYKWIWQYADIDSESCDDCYLPEGQKIRGPPLTDMDTWHIRYTLVAVHKSNNWDNMKMMIVVMMVMMMTVIVMLIINNNNNNRNDTEIGGRKIHWSWIFWKVLHNLLPSPNIRMITSRNLGWLGHVARMGTLRMPTKFYWVNWSDHYGHQGVDGIILKRVLKK
jgi:hypothetical protein